MTGRDLSLKLMQKQDIPELTQIIKRCGGAAEDDERLLRVWDFRGFDMTDCRWFYKIMQSGECIGAVNLAFVGMEAMLIRQLAYTDRGYNVSLFELLKRQHPEIVCWNIYFSDTENAESFCVDTDNKKRQFADDNGFTFYTDARWSRYIKMLKPHDEVYNSSRYRFALLDGSMDGVSFRFFGVDRLDFYDGRMTNWRITDCNFSEVFVYDTWMGNSRFVDTGIDHSSFQYVDLSGSTFKDARFTDCSLENCDITGMTIDDINVSEALELYRRQRDAE